MLNVPASGGRQRLLSFLFAKQWSRTYRATTNALPRWQSRLSKRRTRKSATASHCPFSICAADHQFQSRPRFINRAYFDINKSERQCGGANHVFGHVGCHAGGFFRPGYPNYSGIRNFLAQDGQSRGQFAALLYENMDKTRVRLQAIGKSDAFGVRAEQMTIMSRRVDCYDGEARFNSHLL